MAGAARISSQTVFDLEDSVILSEGEVLRTAASSLFSCRHPERR
jgi:hypothetical protein